jgi:Rha family phage regulatory protein
MTVPVLNFQDFIASDGEQLLTTSQQVAAVFGKRHDHVIDKVRALMRELPEEFNAPNFRVVAYRDAKGESRVSYQMTRDGFTLLAMGFTGKKALAFKVAYINAFNAMAAYIKNQREGLQFDYLRKELEYKTRKGKISACAREMRGWQDEKPERLGEMNSLLEQMQPSLLTH